jgi:hypothetical protein
LLESNETRFPAEIPAALFLGLVGRVFVFGQDFPRARMDMPSTIPEKLGSSIGLGALAFGLGFAGWNVGAAGLIGF